MTKKTNQSALDKLRRLRDDFAYYAPQMLKIRTKQGRLSDFKLNTMQQKIDSTIESLRAEGKPVRIMILKYRQGGASTYTEGRIFHATSLGKLTNSLIVAHEETASTNLFNMSKMFFDELPTSMQPMRKTSNAKEIVFENPTADPREKQSNPGLRSRIKISTANNTDAGRSATIHNLHASEVAFWSNAEMTMLSLLQAVPNTPNTMVIMESTANGIGGYFYEQWERAKRGDSDFVALFFAWFQEPDYEMDVPIGLVLTADEQQLLDLYPEVTLRKLAWRRWCIANNCGGDGELFKQEYPSNDIEAFLTSGRPRFDIPVLRDYLKQCIDGERGYLERKDGKLQFMPDPKGYIEVWHRPKPSREYFIGVDVAKGLIKGDYSAGPVYDSTYTMQALWHGHIDPDLFGEQLDLLGRWYNDGLVAVEENNHGLTTINRLKINEYWNIYRRTTHDRATDTTKEELGFYTTEQTKKLVIDNLARLIRERKLGTKSKRFIQECLTYVIGDDGKTNAQEGTHDDVVMGSAIILLVMDQYVTEVRGIVSPQRSTHHKDRFVRQENGRVKHVSEIEDEKIDTDGWGWFK